MGANGKIRFCVAAAEEKKKNEKVVNEQNKTSVVVVDENVGASWVYSNKKQQKHCSGVFVIEQQVK